LTAGGSLVGLFEMTNKVAASYAEMNRLVTSSGMTGKEFGGLALAAKMTEVPLETMANSMFKLNANIAKANAGQYKKMVSGLALAGIHLAFPSYACRKCR
jgi:hypothetical protein